MKNLILVAIFSMFLVGCSSTWHGFKSDTKDNAEVVKEKVHDGADWVSKKTK